MAEKDQKQEHEPVFSDAEVVIAGVSLVVLDCADLFQFGVPASDIISLGIQTYEYKKGTSGLMQIITSIFELPPGWDVGPWRSIAFGLIVWGDRHPDSIMAKLIKVGEMVAAVKGKLQAKKAPGAGGLPDGAALDNERVAGEKANRETDKEQNERVAGEKANRETDKEQNERVAGEKANRETDKEQNERVAEKKESALSPEEQELEEILSGDYVGRSIRENLGAEQFLSEVGNEELDADASDNFDPEKMGPEMAPKPAKQWAAASDNQTPKNAPKGIINNEQVDLKNPKKKELLRDDA